MLFETHVLNIRLLSRFDRIDYEHIYLFLFLLLHMFFQTFRNDITELPPKLMSNLFLLPDLFTESKSENTLRKYFYGFMKFKRWAITNEIPESDILPSKPFYIALYLASLVQSSVSSSPVLDVFYSLKWEHTIVGAI